MIDLSWSDVARDEFKMQIEHSIALNTASQMGATDKAMDEFITRLGCDKKGLMGKYLPGSNMIRFPFSSNRKRMSTIIENVDNGSSYGKRICLKGASEIVMASCNKAMNADGQVVPLTDDIKGNLENVIKLFAEDALRTICIAYKDLSPGENGERHDEMNFAVGGVKDVESSGFTLISIFGIMDIIRAEVPQAVADVQRAGVTVRMVTGDNIITAQAIAVLCNIIAKEDIGNPKIAMEGKEFFRLTGGLYCKKCDKDLPTDCKCP